MYDIVISYTIVNNTVKTNFKHNKWTLPTAIRIFCVVNFCFIHTRIGRYILFKQHIV